MDLNLDVQREISVSNLAVTRFDTSLTRTPSVSSYLQCTVQQCNNDRCVNTDLIANNEKTEIHCTA